MEINLISFNVPYPPDYGGVIDVYYKIKALHSVGMQVHLHTFEYGREKAFQLEEFCASVQYYKRPLNFNFQVSKLPFIVSTRNSQKLIRNLTKNDFPIIYEGLHTTYPMFSGLIDNGRIQVVRMHNIEHNYYNGLASLAKNPWKKFFFKIEALKLKSYEPILKKATGIAAISMNDSYYLEEKYGKTIVLPAFHRFDNVSHHSGFGDYCLYHSDLSVVENQQVVEFLVKKVFADLDFKLIVAGRNPSQSLYKMVKKYKNVSLFANLSREYLDKLIQEAQINILPVFFSNGIKLKLISALYQGRHCLVNSPMVEGTGLENLCHVANTEMEFIEKIIKLMLNMFDEKEMERRKKVLDENFSNTDNANKLISFINQLKSN